MRMRRDTKVENMGCVKPQSGNGTMFHIMSPLRHCVENTVTLPEFR